MGYVYEIVVSGDQATVPIANVYHVWDGDESETPNDIADVFENNLLVDLQPLISSTLEWTEITVTPLDVANPINAIKRTIAIVGQAVGDMLPVGNHCWVKFLSDDNGFKAGGKLIPGLNETNSIGQSLTSAFMDALQLVFDDFLVDLLAAGLSLAIFRPSLSTPGFPSISTCSNILAKGLGSNNRRQRVYQR